MFIPDTLLNIILYMIKLVIVPVQLQRVCPGTFLTALVCSLKTADSVLFSLVTRDKDTHLLIAYSYTKSIHGRDRYSFVLSLFNFVFELT